MKTNNKIAAALDIGSAVLRMEIAQRNGREYEELENYEYPLNLGKETFNQQKIGFGSVKAVCEMINKYYDVATQIGVSDENITLTATTAIREAHNRDYVMDQIMVKTGHKVKVLEDGEEKTYIFREMINRIQKIKGRSRCYLIAYIGTGSLGVAVVRGGKVCFSQNIRVGSLKLNEIIDNMALYEEKDLIKAVHEYINATFDQLQEQIKKYPINQLYISGKNIDLLNDITGKQYGDTVEINKEELVEAYREFTAMTTAEIKEKLNITQDRAQMLQPTLILHDKLMEISQSESVRYMDVSLCHAMLYKSLYPDEYKRMKIGFERSSVSSAYIVAKNYKYDKNHATAVGECALTIFDNLKKLHGFSRRERLYLEVAGILHDIGKFVNLKEHNRISADIILDTNIIGLTKREIAIIANIARYHSNEVPSTEHFHYKLLSEADRIIVSKLSAIIRLADALDRSHQQKISSISLKVVKNKLKVTVKCTEDMLLEHWTFNFKSQFFEEVFGLKCQLINKK